MYDNDKTARLIKRYTAAVNTKMNWDSLYNDANRYCVPERADYFSSSVQSGERRDGKNEIYDSTAIRGIKVMAAGFHSNLTNPSSKWFNLRALNQCINVLI
jgi:hypothetical protein